MKPTKEEIDQYRQAYQAEVRRINDEPGGEPLKDDELKDVLNRVTDELAIDLIRQGIPPDSAAYDFIHYN